MTEKGVAQIIAMMNTYYPKYACQNVQVTVKAWHLILEPFDYEQVQSALIAFVSTDEKRFPPAIGQLIAMINKLNPTEQLEKTALDMWAEYVYPAIQDSTYHSQERFNKMPPMVQKAVGTASQLKHWAIDEDFNMGVAQSQFVRSYNVWLEREKELQRMPRNIRPESVLEMKPIEYAIEDKSFEIEEGVEAPENLQERILSTFAN